MIKKQLFILSIISLMGTLSIAATQGDINIVGTVQEQVSISIADNAGTDLSNLGATTYDDVVVGDITLDSNDGAGFKLTLTSANNGKLAKDGTGTASDETIAYTVRLNNASGTLGDSITISAPHASLDNISATSVGEDINFVGSDTSPTISRKYDIAISSAAKSLKQGSYSDTITVEIANL